MLNKKQHLQKKLDTVKWRGDGFGGGSRDGASRENRGFSRDVTDYSQRMLEQLSWSRLELFCNSLFWQCETGEFTKPATTTTEIDTPSKARVGFPQRFGVVRYRFGNAEVRDFEARNVCKCYNGFLFFSHDFKIEILNF